MREISRLWTKKVEKGRGKWTSVEQELESEVGSVERQMNSEKSKSVSDSDEDESEEFYDATEDEIESRIEENYSQQIKTVDIPHSMASGHTLWTEMETVTLEQLHYARLGVGEGGWTLFAEDGEMRLYKRVQKKGDGRGVDPLKAVHTVRGVTAYEMCHHFFNPHVRMEWETTLDKMTALEAISQDAIVFHQIHKRVWPTTQRDAVFWSHIRSESDCEGASKTWIVCNHSTKHQLAPVCESGKYIRANVTISMVCQTTVELPENPEDEITRNNLLCKVTYSSQINLGGWAPAAVIKAVYKREYPRFLKKFTNYVYSKCENKPILFEPLNTSP